MVLHRVSIGTIRFWFFNVKAPPEFEVAEEEQVTEGTNKFQRKAMQQAYE